MQKFNIGDRVRVIKYGHLHFTSKKDYPESIANLNALAKESEHRMFYGTHQPIKAIVDPNAKPSNIISEDKDNWSHDICPDLVGQEGVVDGSYADLSEIKGWGGKRDTHSESIYSLTGIRGKVAWYNENQLELIEDGKV